MMRIGLVAGEASGDLLGAGLIRELKKTYPEAVFEGIGGPLMQGQGLRSLYSMEKLAVMGLIGPRRLVELLLMRRALRQYFLRHPPRVFIGIDAPDFNLTLEKKLHERGIKTVHYVSPSVWAWRRYRLRKIRRAVDHMLTLFPFEADFYQKESIPVTFVGHPMADQIPLEVDRGRAREALNLPNNKKIIALLPGSRVSELKHIAATMLACAKLCLQQDSHLMFVVPFANQVTRFFFETLWKHQFADVPIVLVDGRSREVIASADVVLLASGTATLETAMINRPMVVTYKMGSISFKIYKSLVKVSFISLPNLLAGKALVPELIQQDATPAALCEAVLRYLKSPELAEETRLSFADLHLALKRDADNSAARIICDVMVAS